MQLWAPMIFAVAVIISLLILSRKIKEENKRDREDKNQGKGE